MSVLGEEPTEDPSKQLDDVVAGALQGLFGRDSVYMILWAVQIVAAALITPLMTRALDAPNFGAVAAATAIMQVIFVLAGFGLYQAIQKQYARDPTGSDPAKLLGVSLVAAALATVVVDITGPVWSAHVGFSSYAGPVRLAVVWAGASAVTNSALALLRSQDRLLAFGTVSMIQSVVAAVTSLVLVEVLDATATMFLVGQVAVQAVAGGLALALTRPRLPGLGDRVMVKEALAFGLPLVPAVLCTFVLNTSDRLLIQAHLGATEVARYQVAYNVGSLPMLLLGVLNSSWMPRIFSFDDPHERAAVLAASRNLLYVVLMPVLVGLAVGAPIVLRIWAPANYQPDRLLVVNAIVLISAIPYAAAQASTRSLLAQGRSGTIAVAQAIAAAANIGLNLALIPPFGLAGSAAATFMAFAVLHLIMSARARVSTPAPVSRAPARLTAVLVAVAGIAVAVSLVPAESLTVLRLVVVPLTVVWFAVTIITKRKVLSG